jgi:hypothetical protein
MPARYLQNVAHAVVLLFLCRILMLLLMHAAKKLTTSLRHIDAALEDVAMRCRMWLSRSSMWRAGRIIMWQSAVLEYDNARELQAGTVF